MTGDINSLAELFPTRSLRTARQAVRHAVALDTPDLWRVHLHRTARDQAFEDGDQEAYLMASAEDYRLDGVRPAERALNDLGGA